MSGLRAFGRALVANTLLVLAGFVFATWLAAPGLAVSLRALARGEAPAPRASSADAFEAARARALALLDEEP